MSKERHQRIYRKDYRPPDFLIDEIDLSFDLEPEQTIVGARTRFRRNPKSQGDEHALVLPGEGLQLRSIRLNGVELKEDQYTVEADRLSIFSVPSSFELETEVAIRPAENTLLEGLYTSGDMFCTQCEAEGFRHITYHPDRPDVMSRFTARIEADKARYPVLLSNGNRLATGELPGGRHWVQWEDPFRKPSYLFALVAGDLVCTRGTFTTRSGREVQLEIWVEPENIDKTDHALRSLKHAMRWDEQTFGLEYDLDVYMIVAVNDFNMGAMENKGLNVFNSKYVLAKPETATDDDYEAIEGVIGHEYFHNWTGNRVTCRDWFQLTLKEGLTVFRDQEFSADMTSAAVKRIQEVTQLRTTQFPEDAGPMAHPIRPESYIEMNNFYTATVYSKGAEVIRLYQTLLGREGFRKGLRHYLQLFDGEAATCDDFRQAMADANDAELAQFERWYSQAGTPVVTARGSHDPTAKTYELTLRQSLPSIAGQKPPEPLPIPIRVGLLGRDGHDLPGSDRSLQLNEWERAFIFEGVPDPPIPSIARNFSAPVKLDVERSRDELAFLMAHDSDPFNRWEAGQDLSKQILLEHVEDVIAGRELEMDTDLIEAFRQVLLDPGLDGSMKAYTLLLPSERLLAQEVTSIDPDAIHDARQFVLRELGLGLRPELLQTYEDHAKGSDAIEKKEIDRRRIANRALAYLVALEEPALIGLAANQFAEARNMTDYEAAFFNLVNVESTETEEAVEAFHERWKGDPLVLDKWFQMQALSSRPRTFERVVELSTHPDFTLKNPNRARSLLYAFSFGNQVRFHERDGKPYEFLATKVLELDAMNPQVAARIVSCFNTWKRFEPNRKENMRAQLERIGSEQGLSKDVSEIVGRALADEGAS